MSIKLIEAATKGNLQEVESLVSTGADVNYRNEYDSTALHFASGEGRFAVVEHLISHGANVNAANKGGSTPLHWACDSDFADVVQYLVSKGADMNAANKGGGTPLGWAQRRGCPAVVGILESAAQRLSPGNVSDRRSAILSLISENDSLRTRLGIKSGLEVKQDFDLNRLVEIAIRKRGSSDPLLRTDACLSG